MTQRTIEKFDNIIQDDTIAAIVMRQYLTTVEGETPTVIFPPTYADIGYNIETLDQSGEIKNVCTIDSVGSQANRMEPLFKKLPYSNLVPQIEIEIRKPPAKGQAKGEIIDTVNLLDAGHRIADAVVRFSSGADEIQGAFQNLKNGNAIPMAKLSPTSLVFGCWDSRDTQEKVKRIIRSTIRGYNVHELNNCAQYLAPVKHYEDAGLEKKELEKTIKGKKKGSIMGFYDNPSGKNPGGVCLDSGSQVIRDAALSLSALRGLQMVKDDSTVTLRRYIFGLSLVAISAPQEPLLRMGCELTADPEKPSKWELVRCDGTRELFSFSHDEVLAYAQAAASAFEISGSKTFVFDSKKANEALKEKGKKENEGD